MGVRAGRWKWVGAQAEKTVDNGGADDYNEPIFVKC